MNPPKIFELNETIRDLRAEVARLREELSVANRNRASLREALGDTTTHLEIEQREHEETKGYRQHAEQKRDALRAVVEEQAGGLRSWIDLGERNGGAAPSVVYGIEQALRAALETDHG